jgi:Xaa-Pro aminopeptidase
VNIPFSHDHLDRLMDDANLDVLLVTSKHNIQYLLGGHRFFFFDYMDAIGVSRYLPVLLYFRKHPEASTYIANAMEPWQLEVDPVWVERIEATSWGAADAITSAAAHLHDVQQGQIRVGIEASFLPVEAMNVLDKTQDIEIADAQYVLERLRACKSPAELAIMEQASVSIVDSMQAVFTGHRPGTTRRELVEALRREQTNRGLTFEYCLASSGPSHNRAPADIPWQQGEVLCLDSGGNLGGYIGDLARMAVMGEPDSELVDLLAEIEAVQQAARIPIRGGAVGQGIFDAALEVLQDSPQRNVTTFVAHGMGLISHEAPRLTATGPVPYPNEDGKLPLQAGMVLSIETTMLHPTRGFIKLEDTIAVTDNGHRAFGDQARGWTQGGNL